MRRAWYLDPFFDVHLDPACDPPAHEPAMFELLGELWGQLHVFRIASNDRLSCELAAHLQNQLVGAALVLSIKVSMIDANEQE
jgi:hypothetical protein